MINLKTEKENILFLMSVYAPRGLMGFLREKRSRIFPKIEIFLSVIILSLGQTDRLSIYLLFSLFFSFTLTLFDCKIEILLLGCCTRFLCTLIKWCSQQAKINHPIPYHWMNELTSKSAIYIIPCKYIHSYSISNFII